MSMGYARAILVAEDDPLVREHIVTLLRGLGHTVYESGNGSEALSVLKARPDVRLLITDMVMPGGMNGKTLAESAKVINPNLRVLFITGYANDGIVKEGRLDEEIHLIMKPFRKAQLEIKVSELL